MTVDSPNRAFDFIGCFENEIGPISGGWNIPSSKEVQIAVYGDIKDDLKICTTIGLHRRAFAENTSSNAFELITECYEGDGEYRCAKLLTAIASSLISGEMKLPKRGSFVAFRDWGWSGFGKIVGVYFSNPVYRSNEFLSDLNANGIILINVIPLVDAELKTLEREGWMSLEQKWEAKGVDIRDIDRPREGSSSDHRRDACT